MTSRDFCFWLQGFLEIQENTILPVGTIASSNPYLALDPKQLDCVKRHLALVFKHEIDPSMGGPKLQAALDGIHNVHNSIPGPGPTMRC